MGRNYVLEQIFTLPIYTALLYPDLVDVEKAKSLIPIPLNEGSAEAWLFGGHIKELSLHGYIGSPADYDTVEVQENVDDYASRITEAILSRIGGEF